MGGDNYARWSNSSACPQSSETDSINIFRCIGYSEIPKTDNWEFMANVRGFGIFTDHGVDELFECDGSGCCFVLTAKPRAGSKAKSAGAQDMSLVMQYTGNTTILYK